MVVRRSVHTKRQVALDQAVLRPLIEVVSRGAVTAGIDDVPDKIAPQHKVLACETVDTAAIVEFQHCAINQIVFDSVILSAAVDSRVGRVVDLVVA